jgi:hypothetical protein
VNDLPICERSRWCLAVAAWLNPRRILIQASVLACCLWGACAVDFATPGMMDRAGNIKFQDFLQFYISARLIAQGRNSELFDQQIASHELQSIVNQPIRVRLPTVYGPQVGLLFLPLARFPFLMAAAIWVAVSVLLLASCIYWLWKCCPNLRQYPGLVAASAMCFPPFFHFFVRGQISVLLLACFSAAFVAFHLGHKWLAGAALGLLASKPQLLLVIPLVLLLSYSWKALAGLVTSVLAQLALTWMYFGSAVVGAYFDTLWHMPRWMGFAEPGVAHVQMHSLRSFWLLLVPEPTVALTLYVLSSLMVIMIAAASWRFGGPLSLRFPALVFAAVLANPHLFVYDLLVLAPALLVLVDWTLGNLNHRSSALLSVLIYLAFTLPLLGPLTVWTHFQLSVPIFVAIQILLWSILRGAARGIRR